MEGNLPPGFRFHPTDEELITYYLNRKVSDFSFVSNAITDIDLNKCEPWDLPGKATIGEKEWYFFSTRDRKYPTGLRTNRATDAGYWKTTGKDKEILHSGAVVGMKKTLVFYKGRAPKGEKTNWVMHEYRLHTKIAYRPTKDEWVVCRVFQKSSTGKKTPTSPQSVPSLMESSSDTNLVNEIGEINIPHLSGLVSPSSSPNAVSATTNSNNINSENNNNSFNNNNYMINNNSNSNSFYNNSMDMNMNWGFGGETTNRPSFAWPSSLLNSNLLGNSSILRPLHYNSSQPRESASHILNPFAAQGDSYGTSSNSNFATSSSTVIDSAQQQPFQTGSIWRRC